MVGTVYCFFEAFFGVFVFSNFVKWVFILLVGGGDGFVFGVVGWIYYLDFIVGFLFEVLVISWGLVGCIGYEGGRGGRG